MNSQPHTHDVKVQRRWVLSDGETVGWSKGRWEVTYGDTTVYVWNWPPLLERRLERGVRRAVRRHDRGSMKVGQQAAQQQELAERMRQVAREEHRSVWTEATPR